MSEQPVSLQSLLEPFKEVEIDFPGYEDFKVRLCHVAREELLKLTQSCTITKWDRVTRQPQETLDTEKFGDKYTKLVVKGWTGLKYSYLEELLPVNISNQDPDDCLAYTEENAYLLMKNSQDFETWVSEVAGNLANFTKAK